MTTLSVGDREVDLSKVNPKNLDAMISRGIRHYLGNEVSARVGSSFRTAAVAEFKLANPGDLSVEQRKAIEASAIPATDSQEYLDTKANVFNEFLTKLYEGEVGISDRGPTVDPFTQEVRSIVKRDVMAVLRNAKKADGTPVWSGKKDPTDETELTFANGAMRTFAQVKETYGAKNEAKVHSEARKRLDAIEKAKQNAVKNAENIDDLI